ncbi:MAG TPA: penicillin acylase family protein [Steroidobacteraceae bacterium]|jgi:penicillin amidase|nr:penicillin acylase family protein [Steroidobacteraceae bacterium]
MRRRTVRTVAIGAALLIVLTAALVYAVLHASLPQLDGTLAAPALSAAVTVERDALGIPTLQAANRADLAYGTGFVHGQDRFFQMDLSRRLAAGELAELFGAVALEQDEKARLFRFRHLSGVVLSQATPEQRALLAAYTRGVNDALASLHSRPWEYWLLGAAPAPWRAEDTVLVAYAMWWDLQYGGFKREQLKREINARLGGPDCAPGWKCALQFLYPQRTAWDSPNEATAGTAGPGAAAHRLDLRGAHGQAAPAEAAGDSSDAGSNNWALAGRLTASGAALVASDMHLNLRVPTTWYRVRMRTTPSASGPALDLNGLTLPGTPLLVAGSNGHVAWGFTNSDGKWLDLHPVECLAVGAAQLRTREGTVPLDVEQEEIRVHGAPSVSWPVRSAAMGVLFQAQPQEGRCWFAHWLAQLPEANNLNLLGMETTSSVEEALKLAPAIGIPHQNAIVGDSAGHIAWTVFGRIPLGSGPERLSGQAPWTSAREHPRLVDPPLGRLWSANARPVDDAQAEALLGGDEALTGAGYDIGARAHQIRDDLAALPQRATPADMLGVQLDDRAVFLAHWRALILELLDADALRAHPRRAQFKRFIAEWNARASVDSVGYRLVRAFRDQTERTVWRMLLQAIGITEESAPPDQFEQPLWELVTTRPPDTLAAEYGNWRELLLAQIDATLVALTDECGELARCTWGARHLVRIRHPLSGALSYLARLIDMPSLELPGDHDMPRVQDGAFGASERFAVSPGHESQGYLHIAGGQSGHPLSPFYRAGFDAWAAGAPLPFLPGSVQHRLLLQP